MQANIPKQYLTIGDKTILEHTVNCLLQHADIVAVIIAISDGDEYFAETGLQDDSRVTVVSGGKERADSVLSGLIAAGDAKWVMVHDAARPCLQHGDLDALIDTAITSEHGAILAAPVRDTMKRADSHGGINETVCREQLWHALTPQMFPTEMLRDALKSALENSLLVTDEASAIELAGGKPKLVQGSASNIKVTQPDDLNLAAYYLSTR